MKNQLHSAVAILLTAVIICTIICLPPAKAETSFQPSTINLLVAYDESYADYFYETYNVTNHTERVSQMIKLAEIPLKNKFNASLSATVLPFESVFGSPSPATTCACVHPYGFGLDPNPRSIDMPRVWTLDQLCSCGDPITGITYSSHLQHHIRTSYYDGLANTYANTSSSYDKVFIIVGHQLCYYTNSSHTTVNGAASGVNGNGSVVRGLAHFKEGETGAYQFYNWLYMRSTFWHELSHNYGLYDVTNKNSNCDYNTPCVMRNRYDAVVFTKNVWCENCQADLAVAFGGAD